MFYSFARLSQSAAVAWLAAASLFFYGWWRAEFVIFLLLSIVFNYGCGVLIGRIRTQQKALPVLVFALIANLTLLAFFKYADLLIGTTNGVFGANFHLLQVALPIGISFFTFTQIAFLVDTYRRIVKEYDFIQYLLFVTYFPHLIAGPVLHHKQMMPQFNASETFSPRASNIAIGLVFLVIGLAKKILIADKFAPYASGMFDNVAATHAGPHLVLAWVGALAYTFQIYFDFSGYSDMAIGISRMFGVKLPLNFDSPYKATSIIDFWRRWHMSLSQFLRDYLYIPLGGNRKGGLRRHFNLLVTMLLGGLWHGANWTFLVWGGLHGCYLIANHAWNALGKRLGFDKARRTPFGAAASWTLTFTAVMVAWVFFRAADFATAHSVLKGMAGLNGVWEISGVEKLGAFAALAALGFALLACPNSQQLMARYAPALEEIGSSFVAIRLNAITGAGAAALLFLCLLRLNHKSEFLYFQF